MDDYGLSSLSDMDYDTSWIDSMDYGSMADVADVGSNYDFGADANYPSDWWNDASTSQMEDWSGGNYTGTEGDTFLGNLGSGIVNTGQQAWSGLSSLMSNPLTQKALGLGANYLLNNISKNSSGSPPSYQSMGSATKQMNDPYVQSMLAQTSKQVLNSGAAKGVTNPNRLATSVADATYARNLLPLMQINAGQNQAMNTQNMQGWQQQAGQNQSLYGGLGTGINNLFNDQANMTYVDQLVAKILGPQSSPLEKQGAKDAVEGKAPQSEDPEYLKGYKKIKGA